VKHLRKGDVLVVDLVVTGAFCTLRLTVAVLLVRFGSGVAAVVAAALTTATLPNVDLTNKCS
jgi:hypothetical protein